MLKSDIVSKKTITRGKVILFLASSVLIGSTSFVCFAQDRGGFPAPPGGWPKSDNPAPAPPGATSGAGAMPAAAPGQQPIDIVADEQEFAGEQVIAKGNVKVTSKGTVITAPLATLFRDPAGQPQLAIFTGHPHLVQESNKIDADKLTFEIATGIIHADGNAHSEVLAADADAGAPAAGAKPAAAPATKAAPATVAVKPAAKKPAGDWDTDDETNNNGAPPSTAAPTGLASSGPAAAKAKPPEKIYTDSDNQIYEQNTGHFEATGHVKVNHGDIKVDANHLQLVYGTDGKPETALFKGAVSATQNGNNTKADAMTYYLSTQRLQATGNVRSKVIQQKAATPEASPKKGGPNDVSKKPLASSGKSDLKSGTKLAAKPAAKPAATVATGAKIASAKTDAEDSPDSDESNDKDKDKDAVATKTGVDHSNDPSYVRTKATLRKEKREAPGPSFATTVDKNSDEPIYILSDAQDYTKDNGRSTADGNVTVYYDQSVGKGQKVLMLRNEEGRTERIIFFGRSQVTQPGKRWIGDKITFIVPDQRVIAEGNTRAIILNTKAQMASDAAKKDAESKLGDANKDGKSDKTASDSNDSSSSSVSATVARKSRRTQNDDSQNTQDSGGITQVSRESNNLNDDDAQSTRQVSGSNGEQL